MNVTLYAICKNEEKNVEKFINNSKKFSHTIVVDTGSTDNTIQLLRDAGIEVHEHPQTREEFDFSVARNQALSYVKTDWAFSLDFNEEVDELFLEGLDLISNEFTALKHLRFDRNQNGEIKQSDEIYIRLHRTKNYEWKNSVHEIPSFLSTPEYPEERTIDTSIKITKDVNKSLDKELFYISICEREYKKDKDNWFYLWFIFNHYYNIENFNVALNYGQEFLNISKPYFNSFRVECFIKCSDILLKNGEITLGSNYAFHALSEAMNNGNNYMGMAFSHLIGVSKLLNNPNLTIFATGFNPNTLLFEERHKAIDTLYLTNLDEVPMTAWTGHRKFAEWLVSYLKPKVIVDLGVDWGFSTFTFGIPRIGKVYGIDNFCEYLPKVESPEQKYEYVMSKRKKLLLEDNVEIIRDSFSNVAKTWDKKIDILHIDGNHSYESVKEDFETWSKFLNEDGVILMHDTCVTDNPKFGVNKFFSEIDLPKLTFTHTYGLGVVSKNKTLINFIQNNFNLDRPL